jgi:hypothetical protein
MCYLVREPSVPTEAGRLETPPKVGLPGRRWLVAGAALAGTIAMAALVSPAEAPQVREATPVATAAGSAEAGGGGMTRTALPADDDVPTASGGTPARLGHCHEGM